MYSALGSLATGKWNTVKTTQQFSSFRRVLVINVLITRYKSLRWFMRCMACDAWWLNPSEIDVYRSNRAVFVYLSILAFFVSIPLQVLFFQSEHTHNRQFDFVLLCWYGGEKSVRFRPAYDILLLREVVSVNPDSRATWDLATGNVKAAIHAQNSSHHVTLRACRDRLKTLLTAHRKAEKVSLTA